VTATAQAGVRLRWDLGSNISNTPSKAEADVALLASIGGRVARISQEQGWGSPSTLIGPYQRACAAHNVVLFQCCQAIGHVVPKDQAGMDAFGSYCAESSIAAGPKGRTSSGNEVNGFGSNQTPDPHGQATMLLAAAEAIAKANPGARIATPSLCPASGKLGSSYVEPLLFFDAMIAAEPSILAIPNLEIDWHGYGPFGLPVNTEPFTWNTAYRTLALDDDLAKMGHANMKITWSEHGEPVGNGGKDAAFQAQQFDNYLALLSSPAFAHVNMHELVWYTLRDDGSSGWPGTCGLFDIHGAAKPIVAHFTAASKVLR